MLKKLIATLLATTAFLQFGLQFGSASAQEEEKAKTDSVREQTIYVPFTKLRETFEKDGRGIFLPYEEFQELWKKARAAETPSTQAQAPTGALITEIESVAEMSTVAATIKAELSIDLLREGWQQVHLRLADAAILSARIEDKPARLAFDPRSGYSLLLKNDSKDAKRIQLSLTYAKAISKSPGRNQVSFQAPQAPVNRWRIRIPEQGVKINVQPLIAASEAPAATPKKDDEKKADDEKKDDEKKDDEKKDDVVAAPPVVEETVLLAFVGVAPTVAIDWAPKAEGASGLAALASVQAEHTMTVQEGVVRSRTQLTYTISRAELNELEIEAPADHKVAGVFDANVRGWEVEKEENRQVIKVQLFEPARSTQSVSVELEKFIDESMQGEIQAPVVKARNVGRQQGVVVVSVSGALRADPQSRSGLLQLDTAELPANLKNRKWALAYRYAALPFDLTLRVEKLKPRIEAIELVEAYLEPERMTVDLLTIYNVERVGVFRFLIDIPDGWDLRTVRGQAAAKAKAAAVDGWQVQGDDSKQLVVNLSKRAFGRVGLFVELQKTLDDPNLLTPTGETSTLDIPLPQASDEALEHSTRRLIIYSPESLRVTPKGVDSAQAVPVEAAVQLAPSMRAARMPELRPIQAYAFGKALKHVELDAGRRRPHITAAQLMEVRIDSGVVHYTARFDYTILYSGVKTLRIDAPADVVAELGDQAQGRPLEPVPADVPEGYIAWELTSETEFTGKHSAVFKWDRKIDQLEVGKSVTIESPVLKPHGADRAWGQVAISKDETLDVRPDTGTAGLRPIDPRHDLMPEAAAEVKERAARAFEFHEDWKLLTKVTRYELEDVKRTSIEGAVVRMVVTRSDQTSVQALYRVRSARQRLVLKLPDDVDPETAFDTQPLRINGASVPLERGEKGEYFVPLAGHDTNEPFLLELKYSSPGDQRRLALPTFPNDPAVQKVNLCVYLPRERILIGASGPWTDTQEIGLAQAMANSRGHNAADDQPLINELISGISVPSSSSFPTDGTLYIFSALRPAPDGYLRLTAVSGTWFFALMFIIIACVGIALLFRPVWQKLAGLAAMATAFVLIGAFLPTLFRQLADDRFGGALFLMVMIWGGQIAISCLLVVTRWRLAANRASVAQDEDQPAETSNAGENGNEVAAEDGSEVIFDGEVVDREPSSTAEVGESESDPASSSADESSPPEGETSSGDGDDVEDDTDSMEGDADNA